MIKIKKTGIYIPELLVPNSYFSEKLNLKTSPEWIENKIGIKTRSFSNEKQYSSDLGHLACKDLLEEISSIDMIIVASVTSDFDVPSIGSLIQKKIGCECPVISINVGCSGFVYAFDMACQYIISNSCKKILVIGADTITKLINFKDRLTAVFFGDGAGAVVLERNKTNTILSRYFSAKGEIETISNKNGLVEMDGKAIWNFVLDVFPKIFNELLNRSKLSAKDVDLIIPHQANAKMIEAAIKKINFPIEKTIINIEKYGNTVSASIPIALHEAILQKKIKNNDKVMLIGYGAGLSWGGVFFEY